MQNVLIRLWSIYDTIAIGEKEILVNYEFKT